MKPLAYVLLVLAFALPSVVCASVEFADDIIAFGNYTISDDIIVSNGIMLEAHNLVINDSLRITNFGEIHGGIEICANCVLELQNSGVFDADVTTNPGSKFIQVISSDSTATHLGLDGGYDVRVQNANGLTFSLFADATRNADAIEFNNAEFNAGRVSEFSAMSGVTLYGNNTLIFDDMPTGDVLLFSDISGTGAVYAVSRTLDKLHVLQTFVADDDVYVRIVRSTDYARIFNNDMGCFLNELRANGADEKLFAKLDSVPTMDEINKILSQSVRTNPIKLLQPIKLFYRQKTLDLMHIDDFTKFGVEPLVMYSSDSIIGGVRPNLRFDIFDSLHLELSGYVLNLDYSDDINEYRGSSYGFGVNGQFDLSNVDFLRLYAMAARSYFNVGPVFDNGRVISNPDGTNAIVSGEYAHRFQMAGAYFASPFVMLGAEYMNVANSNDVQFFGGGGADIGYEYEFDGLRYNYALRGVAQSDGTVGVGVNVSAWSNIDAAGANVHIGVIRDDDFGVSYVLSINSMFQF